MKIFGSPEPNVLGIKAFDDAYLEVLASLLRGLPDKKIKAHAANKPAQLRVDALIASIKTSPLFKSIFRQEATTPGTSKMSGNPNPAQRPGMPASPTIR